MTLAHDVTGEGPLVVLVHSTATDRRMWDPQVPELVAAGHRVLRCDLRGYGGSPAADGPYNDADDVLALVADDRFALVGASGGGWVALEMAARHPARVTTLALLCTAAPGLSLPELWGREEELLVAGDLDAATELNVTTWLGPEATEETRRAMWTMQRHAFELQQGMPEFDGIEYPYAHSSITARTLLLTGAHDLPEFHDIAVRLATEIPGARHVHLDWAGHLPSMERPDLINPILLDFLGDS